MGVGPEEETNSCLGEPPPYLLGITGGPWLALTSVSSSQVFLNEAVVSGSRLYMSTHPSPLHRSLQILEDDGLVMSEYLLDTAGLGLRPAQGRSKKCQQQ